MTEPIIFIVIGVVTLVFLVGIYFIYSGVKKIKVCNENKQAGDICIETEDPTGEIIAYPIGKDSPLMCEASQIKELYYSPRDLTLLLTLDTGEKYDLGSCEYNEYKTFVSHIKTL